MAIRGKIDQVNVGNFKGDLDGSTAITTGSLLYRDTTNGVVKEATSSVGITTNVVGVSTETVASGATLVGFKPVISGLHQLWEADCTSNTAANQLWKAHAMTDARTVANTSSHITTTLGVFIAVALVGINTDKKLLGYFVTAHQVTA